MRRAIRLGLAVSLALFASACGSSAPAGKPSSSDAAVDADGSSPERAACVAEAGFSACVHTCGEATNSEATSATCTDGAYHCAAPLVPAVNCPDDSWVSGPFKRCGPWVDGYDCTTVAVCSEERLWTCPGGSETDASASTDGGD
jgi:hypothetical protein